MSEVVSAYWAKNTYRVRAFWTTDTGKVIDRGLWEFRGRTTEDDPSSWEWLTQQIDGVRLVPDSDPLNACDLIFSYLEGNVVVGRDPIYGAIKLILSNAK